MELLFYYPTLQEVRRTESEFDTPVKHLFFSTPKHNHNKDKSGNKSSSASKGENCNSFIEKLNQLLQPLFS